MRQWDTLSGSYGRVEGRVDKLLGWFGFINTENLKTISYLLCDEDTNYSEILFLYH